MNAPTISAMRFTILAVLLATVLSTSAHAQNYQGYLDGANCTAIGGWAEDANNLGSAINVDIYDGPTLVTTTANLYRSDVGYHAYNIATPASLKNGQYHYIYVKFGGTQLLLSNSDQPLYCSAGSTGYQYYYSDIFTADAPPGGPGIVTAAWYVNGASGALTTTTAGGLGTANPSDLNGGSLISKAAVPDGSSQYEVKATLNLAQSGGNYALYLRATSDALYSPTASGTYYSLEIQNPTFSGGSCSAILAFNKRVNGVITQIQNGPISCHNGMTIRFIYTINNWIAGYIDNILLSWNGDSAIGAGQPGVGVRGTPAGNGIARVDLGPLDRIAPQAPQIPITSTAFPNRIDLQWPGTVDDSNGVGLSSYWVYRNGAYLANLPPGHTTFSDTTVAANSSYTYQINTFDYHLNYSIVSFAASTPPVGSIDPRQVGVTGRLYFPDGSFWTFGSMSAGTEQDSGTMYPTLMEDTNGNQVAINYNAGANVAWANSSSRIQSIQDLRGTFSLTYAGTIPRLTSITNNIGTAENYQLSYNASSALVSPWSPQTNFETIDLLSSLTQTGTNLTTSFAYDVSGVPYFGANAGTGELAQVTTPYGGHLRWSYQANTLAGSRAFREVQSRYLLQSSGGSETGVSIYRDSGDTNRSVHLYANFFDWSGGSNKVWWFETNTSLFNAALQTAYEERNYPAGTALFHQDSTWAQTPTSANPYISSTLTTLDPSQTYQAQKKTSQTVDQYGNLATMQVYNFGNLSTPVRTYTNTYLTSSNYTSRYMFNRLRQSTVTDGTNTTTLSYVYYDGEPGSCGGSSMIDPSLPPGLPPAPPITMHDASYGVNFLFRGIATGIITPASTVCNNFDIGGNITSSSTNGVTTISTTTSASDYAAPITMTTGGFTSTTAYNNFLAPTSAIGPNTESAGIGYDANARPSFTDSPSGAHTAITYNDTQSPPVVSAVVSSGNTNPHWSRKTMDGFGRTIKSETGSGSTPGNGTVSVVDTVYAPCGCSPLGKLWKTTMPHLPNATQFWTVYTYDGSGRTLSMQSPDGSSTTNYVYQGNTVKVTDPALKWKKFTMDAMGNLTSVLETDPSLGQVTTAYTYDMLSHLTQVTMPRSSTTQNRYFNYTSGTTVGAHLLSTTNPENGQVSYTYNSDHTLNTKTDAKGQVFTYAYDGLKRLYTVSVGGNVLRTYSYDTNPYDANYSQYSAGRLTAIQYAPINYEVYFGSPQGSTTFTDMFTYTQPGQVGGKRLRVTKVQPYLNGQNHTQTAVGDLDLGYGYNKEGKLSIATYPTDAYGHMPYFYYSFDPMMRAASLTDQSGASVVSGVLYGPANELTQMTYNGGTETRVYNSMLQLTSISGLGQSITYTFPAAGSNAGKIASQTDNISGETVNYLYDSLNRLTSASATSNAWSQTYSYDGFGNLTNRTGYGTAQSTTIGTPANAATNQLSGYTYDLNGNQISTGYAYDAENRLVQANAGAVQYAYDGQNKRIWQATFSNCGGDSCMSSDSISIFGIDGKLVGTYTAGAAWNNTQTQIQLSFYSTTQRVYFGKQLVATLDWQGNQQGVVQDRLESVGKYYPFGEERNLPPLANDQVKFATYTRDSATGLDYADQRYYTSTFGRFMTSDSYQASAGPSDPASWNRYSYVGGGSYHLH